MAGHRHVQTGLLGGAVAGVLVLATFAGAEADDGPGCARLFRAGATVTFSGKTTPGKKNKTSDAVALGLTAGPSSATGVSIAAGRIGARRFPGGSVTWRSKTGSRWGNRCLDAVAPDGRRWSFLALSWEEDNEHPNLHAVIDWADGDPAVVGFIDTKDDAFHEAQVILGPVAGGAAAKLAPGSGDTANAARSSLCQNLFAGNDSHLFVGAGYATEPHTSPGYLELHLKPAADAAGSIALTGEFIATDGPHGPEPHAIDPAKSACIDLPDRRYAMLQLSAGGGSEMILWLWGEGGVPQNRDRLVGYVTFQGSKIVHSKVALWRL